MTDVRLQFKDLERPTILNVKKTRNGIQFYLVIKRNPIMGYITRKCFGPHRVCVSTNGCVLIPYFCFSGGGRGGFNKGKSTKATSFGA